MSTIELSDLKIGDLIVFMSKDYVSCDMIIGFSRNIEINSSTLIHIVSGNTKSVYFTEKILAFYSAAVLTFLTKIDNNVWVFSYVDQFI